MRDRLEALQARLNVSILGQETFVELLLTGFLSGGHLLIEGMPGLAKTTAVQALAQATELAFQRIQFTPDMIPGDITGSEILRPEQGRFEFIAGPLFSDLVLADEINRAPPKVQSALLEAMQEGQVTAGGQSRALSPHFLVIATQNPIEHEGTYPLPEAQLDRFLLRIDIGYPATEDEVEIVRRDGLNDPAAVPSEETIIDAVSLDGLRETIRAVYLDDMLVRYIVTLVGATRHPGDWDAELGRWIDRGASPRASIALARASRALACLRGRDFVEPDDILSLAEACLGHRIAPSFAARSAGIGIGEIVAHLVDCVPIP